jgi:beta-lactamase regulating signal transducer with metallopeptidase domain
MSADLLAHGFSGFVSYLAEPALRSLVIGCVAAVALAAFRVKRVTVRLLVWTGVLCAALAMPLLGAFLPRVQVGVPAAPLVKSLQMSFERGPGRLLRNDTAAPSATVRSAATTVRTVETAVSERFVDYAAPRHAAKSAVADATLQRSMSEKAAYDAHRTHEDFSAKMAVAQVSVPSVQQSGVSHSIAPVARRGFAIPWTVLLLGIYLAGVALLLARLLIGVCFSARLSRAAETIDDREAMRLLRFRSCIAGLANAPRLKESAMLAVPATVGVRSAVILLPADWRTWSEEQLDAILAHEISHVARRDALVQMLSLVHRAIFWFSPLPWWLDKQLTDLAEQASDEAALAGGADRARYAETLLGFFGQLGAAPGRVWWQGVSFAKGTKAGKAGSAERRVDRILAWRGAMSLKKSFAVALIAIAAPVVFLAASVHPFIAQAQDKPSAPPNIVQAGGPVAPVLPKAPKGRVAAPAVAAAPVAPAPGQGVVNVGPTPPAPSAPPPPGAGPVAPAALTGPVVRIPSQPATAAAASTAITPITPINPTTPITPPTPITAVRPQASAAPRPPEVGSYGSGYSNDSYRYSSDGPRYVIMSGNSNDVNMSGSDEDLNHARELQKKISGDFIWFERDEKSYVITDPGFIAKARALFAPEDALSKLQDELSRQQDALSKQQDALSERQDSVKVKVPDISPDIKRVQDELDALRQSGATQSELGRLQSELGRLQGRVGGFQSEAGAQQSVLGRQQSELGRQQSELGQRQGELGRQQGEIARKASQQLRGMFDDAIAKGIAKPE